MNVKLRTPAGENAVPRGDFARATAEALRTLLLFVVIALLCGPSAHAQEVKVAHNAPQGSIRHSLPPGDFRIAMLNEVISLDLKKASVKDAIDEIGRLGGLGVMYREPAVIRGKRVTINLQDVTVLEALHEVVRGTDLRLFLTGSGQLLVVEKPDRREPVESVAPIALNPTVESVVVGSISGHVTEVATGDPLPGVNVMIPGTSFGTATGPDGSYIITGLEAGTYTVRASYVGYNTQEVTDVPVADDEVTTLDFALQEDVALLDEIVVVGYGTQSRQNVTGAISSVSGDALAAQPVTDVSSALQGRAAGVEIVKNGGAPGSTAEIRIRGTGTVNDATPLVVIDGVPVISGGIDAVDPDNIQSVEVLKDASAAAIYGNRAANGVVLITTKRGSFDEGLKVSFRTSAGISSPIKTLDVLDAPMLAQLKQERYVNDGLAINPIWEVDSLQLQRTNWQDELLDNGSIQDYNLSISGGNERSTYFLSGTFADERGMMKSSYFRRYGLNFNSDHRVGSRIQVRQNLLLTRRNSSALNTLSAQNGVLWSAIRFHPGLPVRWADGSYGSSQITGEFGDINNPIHTVDMQDQRSTTNQVIGNVEGQLDLVGGLSLKGNVGLDYREDDFYAFNPIIDDQIRARSRNSLERGYFKNYSILSELSLNYDATLAEHHAINAFGAYSVQTFDTDGFNAERMDFTDESEEQRVLNSGNTISDATGTRTDDALLSYITRVNYSYKDRYLLSASFRADASSRFSEDNRWGYFPAVSAGWRISEESFFEALAPTFNSLKITAGWGRSGNQSVDRLQYLGLFGRGARYTFGGQSITGVNLIRMPNPNISWETAEMTNLGLDMSFFDYRLRSQVEFFIKNTKDVLLAPPTVGMMGLALVPDENVGQIRNHGVELTADYSTTFRSVNVNFYGNAAAVRNKVISLNEEFLSSVRYGRQNQEISRTYEGHPIATFFGWRTDGLYQNQAEIDSDPNVANDPRRPNIAPGDVRFLDLNDDGVIDDQDRTILGSPHPNLTYGFGAQFDYRGLDLGLNFVGAAGVEIFNADRMTGLDPTYPFNMYQEVENRWHGEGTSNSIPRMTTRRTNLNHRASDLFIEPGDFLRLKTVTLGYTLPQGLIARTGVTRARLYVTGQNMFTLTPYSGMDPELGYVDGNLQRGVDYAQYPQARTWTIGATVDL